jgi:hypothetical protein
MIESFENGDVIGELERGLCQLQIVDMDEEDE